MIGRASTGEKTIVQSTSDLYCQHLSNPAPQESLNQQRWLKRLHLKRSNSFARCSTEPSRSKHQLGKVHGSLARAGKVKSQTPKVAKQEKKKKLTGRAKKRDTYKRRFVNVTNAPGGKRRMNVNPESSKN
ncbi:hypothetical protein BGX28_002707 [Mortierella sp. GBA30]|nr:hypothetical protein BGX28_002707 [Mortierella sp. GBA30]